MGSPRSANNASIRLIGTSVYIKHLSLGSSSVVPSQIAHKLKGAAARRVFQHFPEIKRHL